MTDTRSEISKIFKLLEIDSPAAFTFAGSRFTTPGEPDAEETRGATLAALTQQLYLNCFCRRFTGVLKEHALPTADASDDLSTELSVANQAKSRWSGGWTIISIDASGRILAQQTDAVRLFWPGEYVVPDLAASAPRVGASARVHVAAESLSAQPGFYFAFGESLEDRRENTDIIRFYLSVSDNGVGHLLHDLTLKLNRFFVPYRLKCFIRRAQYWRLDAVVLCVERRFYQISAELIPGIYDCVRRDMQTASPLFTKTLAPGLAFPEDPPSGVGFGLDRCGLLARALLEGYDNHAAGSELLPIVEKKFGREGLSLDKPYLNPGSVDDYEFAILEARLSEQFEE